MGTARTPFQSANDQPLWQPLYNQARSMEYGALLTYDQLSSIVGRDVLTDRAPIYRAMKELERHDQRTLVCEATVGYRIAQPEEHRILADKHRKRSYRQITRGRRRLSSAPRDRLSEDEVRRLDEMDVRMSQYEMGLRHLSTRVRTLERTSESQSTAMQDVQAALAVLRQKGLID